MRTDTMGQIGTQVGRGDDLSDGCKGIHGHVPHEKQDKENHK